MTWIPSTRFVNRFVESNKLTFFKAIFIRFIVKHFYHDSLAWEVVQALPVLLTSNKLLHFTLLF